MSNFEISKSKTDHYVPIIDGIHLHSSYDPIKEAKEFINDYHDSLKINNKVLVLGLGFGYHITETIHQLKKSHFSYEIHVIEPNQELFNSFTDLNFIDDKNLTIICSHLIEKIYSDKELLYFLSSGPTVIAHPVSMNINSQFYNDFMDFSQKDDLESLINLTTDEDLKEYLESYNDKSIKFDDLLEMIKLKSNMNKNDILFKILDQIN